MPSCVFKKCTNSSKKLNKLHGITFHSFPHDELLKHKWVSLVKKQRREFDWIPTNSSRVCSIHFRSDDMYTTEKGYVRLKKTAAPFIQTDKASGDTCLSRSPADDSLNDDFIDDQESTTESATNAYYKGKLSFIIEQKRKLMQENKNLKNKNNRLLLKCKRLKELVMKLKNKVNLTEEELIELSAKK